jgi:hypothetical protein
MSKNTELAVHTSIYNMKIQRIGDSAIGFSFSAISQTTLKIKSDSLGGKDAFVTYYA